MHPGELSGFSIEQISINKKGKANYHKEERK